ncbi:hypothetical protein NEIG_02542 [Nematocida sp. ERTm5]|nr:hypothetical protein NEIG_02542 [Nematocida sp. ERTm5]
MRIPIPPIDTENTTDTDLNMSIIPLNSIESVCNEDIKKIENSTDKSEDINEIEQSNIFIEEEIEEEEEVKSTCISKYFLLAYEGKYGLHSIFGLLSPICFSKIVVEVLMNMLAMNDPSRQNDYQRNLLNLKRPYIIKVFLITYMVYFGINLIYASFRSASLIKRFYNTTAYEVISNVKEYFDCYSEGVLGFTVFIIIAFFTMTSTCGLGGFIPMVWIFIGLQIVYLISEIIFGSLKPLKYHMYRPTTKKMKKIILSIYYVNHIILLSLCLILIIYSHDLIPLVVVDDAYWNEEYAWRYAHHLN